MLMFFLFLLLGIFVFLGIVWIVSDFLEDETMRKVITFFKKIRVLD